MQLAILFGAAGIRSKFVRNARRLALWGLEGRPIATHPPGYSKVESGGLGIAAHSTEMSNAEMVVVVKEDFLKIKNLLRTNSQLHLANAVMTVQTIGFALGSC